MLRAVVVSGDVSEGVVVYRSTNPARLAFKNSRYSICSGDEATPQQYNDMAFFSGSI